eukprot:scaffold78714_cov33-Tisochrysis_lutea.AAC.3
MHVRAELDVLSEADENPWLVKLAYSFQDDENLYLVRPLATPAVGTVRPLCTARPLCAMAAPSPGDGVCTGRRHDVVADAARHPDRGRGALLLRADDHGCRLDPPA